MTMTAKSKLVQARVNLVLEQPFWGTLALRLEPVEDPGCKSFWVDGKKLGFNPEFVEDLSLTEAEAELCRKIMSCSLGHPWRRDERQQKLWNQACAFASDPYVVASGLQPRTAMLDQRFHNKSAETIYTTLMTEEQQSDGTGNGDEGDKGEDQQQGIGDGQKGDGENDQQEDNDGEGDCGEIRDAEGADKDEQQAEWQVATFAAAQAAKARGNLPGMLQTLIQEMRKPKVDWRAALRRFIQQIARSDFSWHLPDPRYVPAGLYMPSLRSETMPPVIILWDTSGSMNALQELVASEVASIIDEVKPERTYVMYWDTRLTKLDEFGPDDAIKFDPKGGGGTDFSGMTREIERLGLEAACLIGLSDLYARFPSEPPDFPVLWASTSGETGAPFGEVLCVEED